MRADCRMRRRATGAAPKRFLRRVLPSDDVESKRAMPTSTRREAASRFSSASAYGSPAGLAVRSPAADDPAHRLEALRRDQHRVAGLLLDGDVVDLGGTGLF